MDKLNIVHFANGSGGGVFSVIQNLLQFSSNPGIQNHVIFTINKKQFPDFKIPEIIGATTIQIFYYSPKWNFYYTCKQLAKLLPGDKSVIVAHDWLELGMASNLGLQNPVVHFLHGDFSYYYELAKSHSNTIDAYVCISPRMFQQLVFKLPKRTEDIFHLRFPVSDISLREKFNDSLHLIYFVRDLNENRKQFSTILKIADLLADSPNRYFFTIAGGGLSEEDFDNIWPESMKERVCFVGFKNNDEILELLKDRHIFLLPSTDEGLPVSLVESMKAGLVPLITDWNGAANELVTAGRTGFYFNIGDAENYAFQIKELESNRLLLDKLSLNCIERADSLFNPQINTKKIEDLILSVAATSKNKRSVKVYCSRLDKKWLPNLLVTQLRKRN